MRFGSCCLAALATACNFHGNGAVDDSTPSSEAGDPGDTRLDDAQLIDAGPPADARSCYGTGLVKLCLTTIPTLPRVVPASPINTDLAGTCTQLVAQPNGGPELCVITGTTVTVASVVVVGSRPLVLLGTDAIEIDGTLDVSSTAGRIGAGANAAACSVAGDGKSDRGGGGGGAGGSFGIAGAAGGIGDTNNNGLPLGTATGGVVGDAALPTVLRGGCAGGAGGGGTATTLPKGGVGGSGGGAVYLIAGNSITIASTGNVFASGAGGQTHPGSAGFEEGGGGGGSGGMIGLDAPSVVVTGKVAANGGGGGGGGGNVGGAAGGDGTTTSYNQPAARGLGDATGPSGDGGAGSAIGNPPVVGSPEISGAGGGGGGLGVVWIDGTLSGAQLISPAPTAH